MYDLEITIDTFQDDPETYLNLVEEEDYVLGLIMDGVTIGVLIPIERYEALQELAESSD